MHKDNNNNKRMPYPQRMESKTPDNPCQDPYSASIIQQRRPYPYWKLQNYLQMQDAQGN